MKHAVTEKIAIPSGVSCSIEGKILKCSKSGKELSKSVDVPGIIVKIDNNEIVFNCERANKKDYKKIKSQIAHMNNIFSGLDKEFVYKLESCNVHFPMTLKAEKNFLIINNFLGEKVPRKAKILPGVTVALKANLITITSNDREAAGQTAANMEKATKIRNRDRRIFQDGIYIVEKPGRE
jgi:large subunit ribosomal protein L6